MTHKKKAIASPAVRYLLGLLRAMVVLMWAPVAVAAVTAARAGRTLEVDGGLLLWSVILSTLSGATALAWRINHLLMTEPERPLVRPWLFGVVNMLGSWVAASLAFIAGRAGELDVWYSLALIIIAAWAGAKGMDILAERYIATVRLPGTGGGGGSPPAPRVVFDQSQPPAAPGPSRFGNRRMDDDRGPHGSDR